MVAEGFNDTILSHWDILTKILHNMQENNKNTKDNIPTYTPMINA